MANNKEFELSGIITARDLKAQKSSDEIVSDLMTTREKMKVYVKPDDKKLERSDMMEIYNEMV